MEFLGCDLGIGSDGAAWQSHLLGFCIYKAWYFVMFKVSRCWLVFATNNAMDLEGVVDVADGTCASLI